MPTTITLTSKYVEDASGNKFAPITTPNAVRWGDGTNLNDHLGGVQADWNEADSTDPSYIQNKPSSLPANGGNAATVNNHTVLSDVPANAVFIDTTYSVMGASGSSHASGLVPDPGSTAGTTKFLREDGTWQIPESGDSVIPVVLLYEPSTPEHGMVMFDAGETNKFYQYHGGTLGGGTWDEISTPHKAIGVSSNDDDWYEIIDGVVSQTAMEYNPTGWIINYINSTFYGIGQVEYIEKYGGGILPTWYDFRNWSNKQDAITFNSTYDADTNPAATMADVSGKEDKMSIVSAGIKTSYSPAINTLTMIGMQSSLTVTLPSISTDTDKVQSLVLILEAYPNYSPNLSIVCQRGDIIYFPPDFSIEANKSYEINCMWAGNNTWIVASHQIFYGGA